jgi:transcriptional regulator with XRE-family HTH domain
VARNELRAAVSAAVRERRKKRNLIQAKLAELLHSSQSRVAKIEAGSNDVSLDLMFRSLFAVGGGVADVLKKHSTRRSAGGNRPRAKKKKTLASAAH